MDIPVAGQDNVAPITYAGRREKRQAMRRQAIIVALLLVTLGVVLGATVFRTDIAQATVGNGSK